MYFRLLAYLCCFLSVHSFAADKVEIKSSPAWLCKINPDLQKKPLSKQINGGYYFPLFERQVNVQLQTDYTHVIRHIENETGVQNASEVSVSFSPEFQQVAFHQVTLWRNGKVISELKPSQIKVVQEETDAEEFIYNGLKRAYVLLKEVRKGDRIEYAYSLVGFNPVFDNNKYGDKIYFGFDTPILNYFETIITPPGRTFYINRYNNPPEPVEEMNATQHVYRWNNPPLKMWQSHNSAPGWFESAPYITISEFKTWQDVIKWGVKLFNNYRYQLPAALKNKIREWQKKANGDQDVFVSHAIDFVQDEVRYLGLEIGAYTHQPHTPAEVFQQLFGDCKDKALLLASILQHEKIPAYIALVNTSTRSKLIDMAPSVHAFDHAIVAIERSDYIFIDPTISSQRGELVNMYVPAYGYALILRDKETTLKPVEPGFLNNSTIREKLVVSYIDTSRFTVNTIHAGGAADRFRSSYSASGTDEMEESFLKYYEKVYEGIVVADAVEIEEDSFKNEITLNESYAIPTLAETEKKGGQKFEVFAKLLYEQLPEPGGKKENAPLALQFPMRMQYTFQLVMPEYTTLDLEPLHIKNESYQFDFDPVVNGTEILLQYTMTTFKDHIPSGDIKKYKSDYKKMLSVLDVEFTDSDTGGGSKLFAVSNATGNINWQLVYVSVILMAAFLFTIRRLNHYVIPVAYPAGSGWPIGGWLIVLGISLALNCIVTIVDVFKKEFFNQVVWTAAGKNMGNMMKLAWFTELVFSLAWISLGLGLFYWLINRRDIFPRMFIWYLGTCITGQLLLLIFYGVATSGDPVVLTSYGWQLGATIIYSLIWGGYILRSERVKYTFLETSL